MSGFGAKVLDDDFLNVSVLFVQSSDRKERRDSLVERLADANQYPCREGDTQPPGFFDRFSRSAGPCPGRCRAAFPVR